MQIPLFEPTTDWKVPKISDLPDWSGTGRVCVDVETCDPQLGELGPGIRRGGFVAGIAVALEDGPSYYIPVAHQAGDNVENPDQAWAYLRDQAKKFTGDVVGMNLSYDMDYLLEQRVKFLSCRFFRDIMLAEPLIDELQFSYKMDSICKRYNIPGKDEQQLRDAALAWGLIKKNSPKKALKQALWKMPARHVAAYGIGDVEIPLRISRKQELIIDDQDLWEIYDLESRLLPVVVDMRRRGVAIDEERLTEVENWARNEGESQLTEIGEQSGVNLELEDMNCNEKVAEALTEVGIELTETTKTGALKLDVEVLEGIPHPVAKLIARAKKMRNLEVKFCSAIRRHLVNGRIHCTFNQLKGESETGTERGAAFGRCSSTDPNLQQQPARDDFANFWRSIYVPDKGKLWASLDYSQQEPRILTHYAVLCNCNKASEFAQAYWDNPDMDFHAMVTSMCHGIPLSEVTDKLRKPMKDIGLGKCYGMGGSKLCHKLKLPTEWKESKKLKRMIEVAGPEGKAILNLFASTVPFVDQLSAKCQSAAEKRGFILTLLNRRCRFPMNDSGSYDWVWKALNRLIQGSAADQTKKAMVEAHAQGFPLQLQVHDELALSISSREEAEAIAEIMRTCITLKVPSKVDIEIGPSWGEAK